jgi:hypothetical protein
MVYERYFALRQKLKTCTDLVDVGTEQLYANTISGDKQYAF